MPREADLELPEVFVPSQDMATRVSQLLHEGRLRPVGPKVYTTNLSEPLERIVSRNLWNLVGSVAPGAVLCYRTAFENQLSSDGSVFVSGTSDGDLSLPGLTIRQVRASGPQPGDTKFVAGLYLASRPRAFLENLAPAHATDPVSRSVGRQNVEHRLAEHLRIYGEDGLNTLRDQARRLAPLLGLEVEFDVLDGVVGTLLRSRDDAVLSAPTAIAYTQGEPYDPARQPVFDALHAALTKRAHPDRAATPSPDAAFYNIAFFDAYFSNYIEGTEFEVDEALGIVFEHRLPSSRPQDAHDILGTWRVVGNLAEMSRVPADFDDFLVLLKRRHALIMEGRPTVSPGEFKDQPNRAGATRFVHPELVRGTLRLGFALYQSLVHPFARALFMMFLVSEVHPFKDGNGRTARAMMNAELVAGGQRRILIPSVYRMEYVGSLKRLTNHHVPKAFLRVMDFAQAFAHSIDFTDLGAARQVLDACHAFNDPADDVKLRMPPPQPGEQRGG